MRLPLSRRSMVLAMLSAPVLSACNSIYGSTSTPTRRQTHTVLPQVNPFLAQLEAQTHGRLGISAINTANNQRIEYQANQRFPLCSTFKLTAVAAILHQSMRDTRLLQQRIHYSMQQVEDSGYAPVTAQHVNSGMTVSELCAACISYSDNAAANLLLHILGGPAALTRFSRSIGDKEFRLDRWEPALNSALPNDDRDTTTPAAMADSLQRLLVGNVLAATQRELLLYWLKNNTTGNARIRAGVPKGWTIGEKTGTGGYGTTNDVGILWPARQPPIILAVYFTHPDKTAKPHDAIIAAASRIVSQALVPAGR